MKSTFIVNLGIKIGKYIYRIAFLSFKYKSIENTYCWNTGWKKFIGRIYVNKIKLIN